MYAVQKRVVKQNKLEIFMKINSDLNYKVSEQSVVK